MNDLIKILKYIILIISTSYLYNSCALSRSQIKKVNSFYIQCENIDEYCNVLKKASINVEFERKKLFVSSLNNDSIMIKKLVESYNEYNFNITNTDSLYEAGIVLGLYFKNFHTCLPKPKKNYENEKKFLKTFEDFTSLITLGIGNIVFKVLYNTFYYIVNGIKIPTYRKKTKEYIYKGKNIVPDKIFLFKIYLNNISDKMNEEIFLLEKDYLKFLQSQSTNKSSIEFYSLYNPIFLKNYHLANSTKQLAIYMLETLPYIEKYYNFIFNECQKRKKLKNEFLEYNNFNSTLNKVKTQAEIIKKELEVKQ